MFTESTRNLLIEDGTSKIDERQQTATGRHPMTTRPSKKPRLVIYGTGTYNSRVVQIADQKGWPIVAAFNRAGAKVGQDLGQVCGLARDIGVTIQDCDAASYDDLDADVAIVAITDRLNQNFAAYQRLMNAGLNVICHGTESYYPLIEAQH
jgi:4-hydroxy-tetrahydrodipicolinate reductase